MAQCTRRRFLNTGLAAGLLAGTGGLPLRAAGGKASDWVTLGKSGVKVTRLAFGTGTMSGRTQRELGQDQFTRLVRHTAPPAPLRRAANLQGEGKLPDQIPASKADVLCQKLS